MDIDEQRFWSKVDRSDEDSCWYWQSNTDRYGYGRISYQGAYVGAHRVALILEQGAPDNEDKTYALHSCGRPGCVNPAHLRWGDQKDNMSDRDLHGNTARGQANGRAKLTAADVREMRRRYADGGETHRTLGEEYNLHHTTVGQILRGENWGHV